MRSTLLAILALLALTACDNDPNEYARIETSMGNITVKLYGDTPRHTENFVKLAKEGFYEGTLFHRVMPNFMIQGGDPQSIGAPAGVVLGSGGPGYMIDPEIGAPHLSGALAAARTPNPEKRSSGSQFYIVTGVTQSDATLDQIERMKGIKYSPAQREAYQSQGGRPDLDQDYTVFGEVTEGMEVALAIANVARNPQNRPNEDVVIERVVVL